ncbi:glycosyltransferase family 2 protein [Rossellomorea sp. AcN35-11]|nr:glycosyltransferase family 2 protein [Rossellomorea sp. AcN35-11]
MYNEEEYLKETVDSVLNQSIEQDHLEVLLVNDGSRDNNSTIINEIIQNKSKIKAFHFPIPSGASGKPINIGLQNAEGEYVIFADPDDLFTENGIELLYQQAQGHDIDIVMGTSKVFNSLGYYQYTIYKKRHVPHYTLQK